MLAVRLPALLTSAGNPVLKAEFRYQRYAIVNGRVGRVWILMAMLLVVPSLLASLFYSFLVFLNPLVDFVPQVISSLGGYAEAFIFTMNFAMYLVVTLVAFGLATNSISRERRGRTWENLILTSVTARQIVWGKWWASLRALNGDFVMIIVLRIGLSAWVILFSQESLLSVGGVPAEWFHFPALIVISTVYCVLDAALTTALGVAATLPTQFGGLLAGLTTALLRLFLALFACAWMILSYMMMEYSFNYLWMALVGFIVYGLLIWAALRLGQSFARST